MKKNFLFLAISLLLVVNQLSWTQLLPQSYDELIKTDTNSFLERKNKLLQRVQDKNNSDSLIIESYIRLADLYASNYMPDKALKIFDTLHNKYKNSKFEVVENIYLKKAELFKDSKNFDLAIQARLFLLQKYEDNNAQRNIALSYVSIADLFSQSKNSKNAFYYLSNAEKLAQKEEFKDLLAKCNLMYGDLKKKNADFDAAKDHYLKAIELSKTCNCNPTLSAAYNNLGSLYRNLGNFKTAEYFVLKAIELNQETNNSTWLGINYNNLGNIYDNLNYISPSAIDAYKKSMEISDSLNQKEIYLDGCYNLAKTYAKIDDFSNAFKYFSLYTKVKDSLNEISNRERSLRLAIQFKSNRKEAEIERLKIQEQLDSEEISYKNNLTVFLALFIIIILIVVTSLWISTYKRKKVNKDLIQKNEQIDEQHKEIIDSINYAKRIQSSILPSPQLLNHNLPNNALLYLPKDIVSGDFYICDKIGNEVFFGVADCTGHGVPGAMVSLVASSVLNKCLHELKLTNTNKILDHLNIEVPTVLASDNEDIHDGMDIALCKLNTETLELQFSGAYLNCWIFNETSTFLNRIPENINYIGKNGLNIVEIKGNRRGIGKSNITSEFNEVKIQLRKGDKIMLSSDGFEDQFGGPKNKKFKLNQMRNLVFKFGNQSVDTLLQEFTTSFQVWKGNNEQVDDVCLMIVEI